MRSLDCDRAESYWLAITEIEAQEMLLGISVSQYPWLKKEDQQKTHKHLHKLAYPKTYERSEVLTTEQAAERFRAIIGV